jgi:hypothetical protein
MEAEVNIRAENCMSIASDLGKLLNNALSNAQSGGGTCNRLAKKPIQWDTQGLQRQEGTPAFNKVIEIVFCEVYRWAQTQSLEAFLHLQVDLGRPGH